jgi:hypothetical protein
MTTPGSAMGGFQPLIATAGNGEVAPFPDLRRGQRNRES